MTSRRPGHAVNRTQVLVLGFFLGVLISMLVIRILAPDVYDRVLQPPSTDGRSRVAFLVALVTFIALLAIGVYLRWRWIFWLMMIAFLAGVLRVPVMILQLTRVMAPDAPAWYLLFQGLIGVIQCVIGLAMAAGYRRAGVWGSF